jgi:hypothetical protein
LPLLSLSDGIDIEAQAPFSVQVVTVHIDNDIAYVKFNNCVRIETLPLKYGHGMGMLWKQEATVVFQYRKNLGGALLN